MDYRFVRTHSKEGKLLKFLGEKPTYDDSKFEAVPIKKGKNIRDPLDTKLIELELAKSSHHEHILLLQITLFRIIICAKIPYFFNFRNFRILNTDTWFGGT